MTTITTAQASYIASLREDRAWEASKTISDETVTRVAFDAYMARYGRRSGNALPDGVGRDEMMARVTAEVRADFAAKQAAFAAALTAPIDGIGRGEASALIDALKATF